MRNSITRLRDMTDHENYIAIHHELNQIIERLEIVKACARSYDTKKTVQKAMEYTEDAMQDEWQLSIYKTIFEDFENET